MKFKMQIFLGNRWSKITEYELNEVNANRFRLLEGSPSGQIIITQLSTNHKLGIMDMSEALEKLFEDVG